jgi:trehalose 6-phosphate synthase/phosphatase
MADPNSSKQGGLHPNDRQAANEVPVTPGIHLQTYTSESPEEHPHHAQHDGPGGGAAGYFSRVIRGGHGDDEAVFDADAEQQGSADVLRKMSESAARGRRESLSEIRASNPDLHVSGNVISATFTVPHSLRYRKGADWVSPRAVLQWRHMTEMLT